MAGFVPVPRHYYLLLTLVSSWCSYCRCRETTVVKGGVPARNTQAIILSLALHIMSQYHYSSRQRRSPAAHYFHSYRRAHCLLY